MQRPTNRLSYWIFVLASGLYFGAVFLRSLLIFQNNPLLYRVLGLQALFFVLYISESSLTRRFVRYFPVYLVCQTVLVFLLLATPGYPDFFGVLFNLISMQAMHHLGPWLRASWIGVCALGMVWMFYQTYGPFPATALSLIYTAGNVFLGAYTLAARRAQEARQNNLALAIELREANRQLRAYSSQLEELAIARERNRLARELHDSVTQTVFSMTLAIQAAIVLLEREPQKVASQLDRLNQLSRSALAEIQLLISQLGPESLARESLEAQLRRHLASGRLPQDLTVKLDVMGDGRKMESAEERGLFRIAEEALNNIVKHSQSTQAHIRLHLADPFWMEVADEGVGFDLLKPRDRSKVGLGSMQERAAEIGWDLHIQTSPGAGTLIRVEKAPVKEPHL